jgi:hypothetical protein
MLARSVCLLGFVQVAVTARTIPVGDIQDGRDIRHAADIMKNRLAEECAISTGVNAGSTTKDDFATNFLQVNDKRGVAKRNLEQRLISFLSGVSRDSWSHLVDRTHL